MKVRLFLSTLSLRRATIVTVGLLMCNLLFLSTLSLRRATAADISARREASISIHALLAESDGILAHHARKIVKFLSTLSLRRATISDAPSSAPYAISIHALLAESDLPTDGLFYFSRRFLSTLSLRRATNTRGCKKMELNNFYPRSPCGERQASNQPEQQEQRISIHALLAESDLRKYPVILGRVISIHALLAESDRHFSFLRPSRVGFLSTLSLRRATWYSFGYFGCNRNFYPRSPCGERQALRLLGWLRVLISIHALLAESDACFGWL